MEPNIKFYKIKFIKDFFDHCDYHRNQIINELVENATDPTIVMRRIRMLENLAEYQAQMLKKIQDFETDDPNDYLCIPLKQRWRFQFPPEHVIVTHRGA